MRTRARTGPRAAARGTGGRDQAWDEIADCRWAIADFGRRGCEARRAALSAISHRPSAIPSRAGMVSELLAMAVRTKNVADASHRLDALVIGIDLRAEARHDDVDDVGLRIERVVPDVL